LHKGGHTVSVFAKAIFLSSSAQHAAGRYLSVSKDVWSFWWRRRTVASRLSSW